MDISLSVKTQPEECFVVLKSEKVSINLNMDFEIVHMSSKSKFPTTEILRFEFFFSSPHLVALNQ